MRQALGALRVAAVVVALLLHVAKPAAAAIIPVQNAQELLQALQSADLSQNVTVELQQGVALSPADVEGYSLPFSILDGGVLRLQGGAGLTNLDFGGVTLLLIIEPGATLELVSLNLTGVADPLSVPPSETIELNFLAIWPSVTGRPNAQILFQDSNVLLFPSISCSPEFIAEAVRGLQRRSGSAAVLYADGLTGYFVNLTAPIGVIDTRNGNLEGSVFQTIYNTNATCTLPSALAPAPAPAPANDTGGGTGAGGAGSGSAQDEGGGGTPGWVWAVVGVGVAVGVAAVAGGIWTCRRRRRRPALPQRAWANGKQDKQDKLDGAEAGVMDSAEAGKGSSKFTSPVVPSFGTAGSPNTSLIANSLEGSGELGSLDSAMVQPGRGAVRESLWRSRVGVIEGLKIGGILGRGAFGTVFKGRWKGAQVAVKIVPTAVGPNERIDLSREPMLSLSLSHPNVLAAYKMCMVRLLPDSEGGIASVATDGSGCLGSGHIASSSAGPSSAGSRDAAELGRPRPGASGGASLGSGPALASGGSSSGGRQYVPSLTDSSAMVEVMPPQGVLEPGMYEVWLVSEIADRGSLADAIIAGALKTGAPAHLDVISVLLCMLDIARGLEYLHSSNILHGDLKPQNVLLKSARADRRGYVCKLCDFGLSRLLGEAQTHIETGNYGTASHASPELLLEGRLTRASDIYALGILCWELVAGDRPFRGMQASQIIVVVTQTGFRPPVPDHCPPQLADLMQRCWDINPQKRPTASAVVEELIAIGSSLQPTQAPQQ